MLIMTKIDDAQAIYILGKYRRYGDRCHTKGWIENQPLVFIQDIVSITKRRIPMMGTWKSWDKWATHWQNGRTGFKT